MDFFEFEFEKKKTNQIIPLSISEVSFFFENRKDLTKKVEGFGRLFSDEKFLTQGKIFEYTKRFGQLKKIQCREIRKTMENLVYEETKLNLEKLQARIILCKIIDLLPETVSIFSI